MPLCFAISRLITAADGAEGVRRVGAKLTGTTWGLFTRRCRWERLWMEMLEQLCVSAASCHLGVQTSLVRPEWTDRGGVRGAKAAGHRCDLRVPGWRRPACPVPNMLFLTSHACFHQRRALFNKYVQRVWTTQSKFFGTQPQGRTSSSKVAFFTV